MSNIIKLTYWQYLKWQYCQLGSSASPLCVRGPLLQFTTDFTPGVPPDVASGTRYTVVTGDRGHVKQFASALVCSPGVAHLQLARYPVRMAGEQAIDDADLVGKEAAKPDA